MATTYLQLIESLSRLSLHECHISGLFGSSPGLARWTSSSGLVNHTKPKSRSVGVRANKLAKRVGSESSFWPDAHIYPKRRREKLWPILCISRDRAFFMSGRTHARPFAPGPDGPGPRTEEVECIWSFAHADRSTLARYLTTENVASMTVSKSVVATHGKAGDFVTVVVHSDSKPAFGSF